MNELVEKQREVLARFNRSLTENSTSGREKARVEGRCRMCQRPWRVRALRAHELITPTRHHLVPQRYWRRQRLELRILANSNSNLVPLCEPCHIQVETDVDARRMLRRCLGQNEIAFIIQIRGQEWLDHRYPKH